jgi:hypothetical protein
MMIENILLETWDISRIKVAGFNPAARTTARALAALKAEIERDGLRDPLKVSVGGVLIDGHRRRACLLALGEKSVPVIRRLDVRDDDESVRRAWVIENGYRLDMTPADWLDVYLHAGVESPDTKVMSGIRSLENLVGRDGLEVLAREHVSPRKWDSVSKVARYCDKADDDDFKRAALWWILKHKLTYRVRNAIDDNVPPDVLEAAIKVDVPLVRRDDWRIGR